LRTVFLQNGRYYRIDVITSMVEEDDLVSELLIALLLLYSGLVVTILMVNNVVLKKAWRPFYKLLEQLKQFRLERPVPLPEGKIKVEEFRLLHTTIGKMLRGVTESYESQKQFIENAAHELQTPLAISINKLESVLASEQLTNEAQAQVTGALDSLERLAGLNRSLLFLSKVENRQFSETENVQINRLTEQLIADFEDQLAYKHIELRQDTGGSCVVRMNAGLAAILLANLIKNALVHNHTGGNIEVTIADKSWSVSNTGRERPLDQQQIFTRFYKTDASSPSTGLGLSIVKAISDLYGFRVVYSHDTMHRFTIHF
jgi:signal transduction histidine kinase